MLNNALALIDHYGLEDTGCDGKDWVCPEPSGGGGGGADPGFTFSKDVWADGDPGFTFTKDVWADGGGISWLFDNGISWGSGPVNVGFGITKGGPGKGAAPTMFLVPTSDNCNASGRHINYVLRGNGQNDYYVREVLTTNGTQTDMVSGATLNGFPDWITWVASPTVVTQTFLGSARDPRQGPVQSFALPVQRNIGGWPIFLDQQPIQRTKSNILVANQPCPVN